MNLDLLIRAVQRAVGVDDDGADGPATWRAIYKTVTGKEWADPATQPAGSELKAVAEAQDKVDDRSEKNIATLLPEVRPYARALIHACAAQGIKIIITSGSRTYAEQDALYAQGRSKPGAVVTNAKGGQSNHNFGVAFDVTLFDGSKPVWESPTYKAIGALGRKIGLEWGGDWKSIVDEPHFQFNPKRYTTAQMRERVAKNLSVLA